MVKNNFVNHCGESFVDVEDEFNKTYYEYLKKFHLPDDEQISYFNTVYHLDKQEQSQKL